ncbi:MAG: N-acylglucosamine 2-epimerase [Alphaproteobacteria bacterium]|nr:N-acylglucosamine 2-epimerase [Alphaproteobacteria bacterium]
MKRGTYTTVDQLSQRLLRRIVPKWYQAFCDPRTGGFYERLGHGFRPELTGTRRLYSQCRQLAIYSHASLQPECHSFRPDLTRHFEHILHSYRDETTGGWNFSLDDEGRPLDKASDLYALSFVIFSFSHYYRSTGDARAKVEALRTLTFIDERFRVAGLPGFIEALDAELRPAARMRRQNPHMHLLEACLFAFEALGDAVYLQRADEIVDLFYAYFFDPAASRLSEFYDDSLRPHPEKGTILEPGHYFEWVWLLKKHGAHRRGADHDAACRILLGFANRFGWDPDFGGIYDEIGPDGAVVKDTKRLWPFTEGLKANVLMLDSGLDKLALKERIGEMIAVFRDCYMEERGFWTEWLTRDLKPATDYMPGTTPYHVYFGIMEARDVVRGRGPSVSLTGKTENALYGLRRTLSERVRSFRATIASR